jgi:hypothetical protein
MRRNLDSTPDKAWLLIEEGGKHAPADLLSPLPGLGAFVVPRSQR